MRGAWLGLVLAASAASAADSPADTASDLRALLQQVEANPADLAARVRLGDAYLAIHDVQAAERSYLAVLDKDPSHAGALFGRGAAAQRRGWWDDAARFYQRAHEADPRREPAATVAALVHARSRAGDAMGVAKAVDRAMALPSEQQDPYLSCGAIEACSDRDDVKRAVQIAEEAVLRFPKSPWVWSLRGWIFQRQGRDAEAAADHKRAGALLDAAKFTPQRTELSLPLRVRATVLQGPKGKFSHLGVRNRHAWDLMPLDERGRTSYGDDRNEEYSGWGAVVVAAADGVVVDVRDGIADNAPGQVQHARPSGKFVYVEHSPGEITRYFHLQKGSVAVKFGETVRRGQPIGRLGNSGYSTKPHICFALAVDRAPRDATRPAVFAKYTRWRKGESMRVVEGCPGEGQWIEPVAE